MYTERPFLTRITAATLLIVLVLPVTALAGDGTPPATPTITVNGTSLPQVAPFASTLVASSSVLTNPWSVFILFGEDIASTTPPQITDGTPGASFTNGSTQTINDCTDTDDKTYCFSYTPPANVASALYWYFKVSSATDLSGEPMLDSNFRFIIDTAGPTLTLDTLSNQVVLPTISGTADYPSAIVDLRITSASTTRTYQTAASGGTWSYTLLAGDELPEGAYTLTASSTDQNNNRGTEVSGTFVIDSAAPTITITSGPADGGYASTSPVLYEFVINDTSSTTVTCSWDGVATSCTSPATSTLSAGVHTFALSATDSYTNTTTLPTRTFTVDLTAPALTETTAIATSTNTTPSYSFLSTEAGSLAFTGACNAATSTVGIGTTTLTFATLAVGSYTTCGLTVTDIAGNTGTLVVSPFSIEAVAAPTPTPTPDPTPTTSGGGSGGASGNGVTTGPYAVGYQTPTPINTPAPASVPLTIPEQVTVGSSVLATAPAMQETPLLPPPPLPEISSTPIPIVETIETPAATTPAVAIVTPAAAVDTPWDKPIASQFNLGAAVATTELQFPSWMLPAAAAAAVLIFAALGIFFTLQRKNSFSL